MAYPSKVITNPKNGMSLKFLQTAKDTNGALLEMEATYQPQSTEPPFHYHPYQAEDFLIIAGEMKLRMNGESRILKAGDRLHIPANTPHSMYNNGPAIAVTNWQVRPALNMEQFFETTIGLAADGKTNANGVPNILQAALTVNKFSSVFRMVKPPYLVQKIIFGVLTPFAYLFGYKPTYKKYLN
ncbi:cupin domain-containing protein [Chitinophaga sp. SYP-B3965]|nr:cupin domain-containing protein [Chitinophaga sp. SYP-B3965]